ncbi:MAG TPA: 3-ketoacyl-ACP reductase [Sporomusaceae bacterium]|nr:3-ketoacyl-ACP reductase [Sporomusaceae bacterium]
MRLKGKVAVVTGAASGMGKEIAILYAREGAKVIVSDLALEAAKGTVAEIEANGGIATALQVNVAREEDIQNLINTAVTTYGTLDVLVNNAGIMDDFVPAADVTDELWERVFAINATGPMRAIRKALPIFIGQGSGVIINVASAGGLMGSRAGTAYTAAKHAVIGMTKNVGFQYAASGIRCNAIAPGAVKTNINKSMGKPHEFGMGRAMAGMNLNPRIGEPEEVARVALFLASEDASFVNGTVIVADAGWTAY